MMRAVALAILLSTVAAAEEPPPRPDFARVDYAHPERYLDLPPTLGSREAIGKIAAQLGGGSNGEVRLRAIARWMREHLRDRYEQGYRWRTVDQIVADGHTNGNCADRALVFGALARALGIPTVWVKTMDIDWIREYVRDPEHVRTWRGHVYLELFLDGRWKLFDASQAQLHDDYDPRAHLLPDGRWAYDKGGDPFALVLSSHGDRWTRQTAAFFRGFDLAQLPVLPGRPIERAVFIVADNPIYKWAAKRVEQLGLEMRYAFNGDWERQLPRARGHWLILTVVGDHYVLPERYRSEWAPDSAAAVAAALRQRASGRLDRALADGTRVVLLYGRDPTALATEIERLTLTDP